MVKAVSPVRLDAHLMESAILTGQLMNRSAAQQVEFWAGIGMRVADLISPKELLSVSSGLMTLKLEQVEDPIIEPETLLNEIISDRQSGRLPAAISSNSPRYQASITHPGMLERIMPNGEKTVGQYKNGEFVHQPDI